MLARPDREKRSSALHSKPWVKNQPAPGRKSSRLLESAAWKNISTNRFQLVGYGSDVHRQQRPLEEHIGAPSRTQLVAFPCERKRNFEAAFIPGACEFIWRRAVVVAYALAAAWISIWPRIIGNDKSGKRSTCATFGLRRRNRIRPARQRTTAMYHKGTAKCFRVTLIGSLKVPRRYIAWDAKSVHQSPFFRWNHEDSGAAHRYSRRRVLAISVTASDGHIFLPASDCCR